MCSDGANLKNQFFFKKNAIFLRKNLSVQKKAVPLHSQTKNKRLQHKTNGALVQSVRISACHAGGHEFESRTHRKKEAFELPFLCI